jgi:two-component sensor histidine kinase
MRAALCGDTPISSFDILLERLAALKRTPWVGLFVGCGFFYLGFLVRTAMPDTLAGFPFLTFFPGVLIAAMLGGAGPGVAVALLSAAVAWGYFVPPYNVWTPSAEKTFTPVLFFGLVMGVQIALIEFFHAGLQRLRSERARVAGLLETREAMFKELQHRVANNMQFVSSMLAMQLRSIDDQKAAASMEQAASRLRAMSRIHRTLYDPSNAERDFGPIVEDLCREILDATGARNIVCLVDIPRIVLPMERVHTLSLIVTEALTNAVKHAFPDGRPGTIRIGLERVSSDEMALIVLDDGRGIPPDYDIGKSQSLGMRIVQSLATQLQGAVSYTNSKTHGGALLRVSFKARET